jgi:hypothetical protein
MRSLGLALVPLLALGLAACGGGGSPDAGLDADDGDGGGDPGPQACQTLNDCPTRHLCLGGFCQPGTACLGNEDCPAQYACLIMKEVCVPENPCTGDPDCTEPGASHCQTGSGVCVACLEDAHCGDPGQVFCNAQFQCEAVGPDCTSDADCQAADPQKPRCDPVMQKCFACVTDAHCSNGWRCAPDTRTCVECYQTSHCTLAPYRQCLLAERVCVQCLDESHCQAGERCNPSSHNCTGIVCTNDNDCLNSPDGTHCVTSTGDCVQCLTHEHCGTYQWCRLNACQSGCQSDADCQLKPGIGNRCNTQTGACFTAECLSEADCAGRTDGKTHCKLAGSPLNPPQYTCVACTDDAHCAGNLMCDKSSGVFACRPRPCYEYTDPNPDQVCSAIDPCYRCDMLEGQCKPFGTFPNSRQYDPAERCVYDAQQPTAQGGCCQGYHCSTTLSCSRNINCPNGQSDCPTEFLCQNGTCEFVSCCNPPCTSGQFCVGTAPDCHCEAGACKEAGQPCEPSSSNCCPGLRCSFLWPLCAAY